MSIGGHKFVPNNFDAATWPTIFNNARQGAKPHTGYKLPAKIVFGFMSTSPKCGQSSRAKNASATSACRSIQQEFGSSLKPVQSTKCFCVQLGKSPKHTWTPNLPDCSNRESSLALVHQCHVRNVFLVPSRNGFNKHFNVISLNAGGAPKVWAALGIFIKAEKRPVVVLCLQEACLSASEFAAVQRHCSCLGYTVHLHTR